jgi:hypothetical protein
MNFGITYHFIGENYPMLNGIDERFRNHLVVFSDASYASHLPRRRSTTGIVVYLALGPILWVSRLHDLLAQSSTEAE